MKPTRKTVSGVICVTLILAAANASALTLGKLRGGALLGKALDVAVMVQTTPGEEAAANCFRAEVRYGASLVDASSLAITTQPGPTAQSQWVRIASPAWVDDAVVTLDLSTSCGGKASRRYVLLSDLVSDVAEAPTKPVASSGAVMQVAPATVGTAVQGAPSSTTAAVKPAAKRAVQPTTPRVKKREPVAAAPVKPPPVAAASQEAVAELDQRVVTIEKWQAETAASADLLKSQERANALDAEVKSLKAIIAKNQQNVDAIGQAVVAVESESYGRSLLLALGALVAACLGAVGFVFTRTRRADDAAPWWMGRGEPKSSAKNASVPPEGAHAHAVPSAPGALAPVPAPVLAPVAAAAPQAPMQNVDLDIDLDGPGPGSTAGTSAAKDAETASPLMATVALPAVASGAQPMVKALNTQDMLDIRQQAEFFMALGQQDDAVKLLENSIRNSTEANPMVFLDLLKIFHTLSRPEGFERYREEFNQQFTGRVPAYADFLVDGNGLDAYEDICQQIVVLWPTEYTVDYIEQCLVRVPEDDPEQGIDLEAFKDLLLLYGILKRLDQASDSALQPFSATRNASVQEIATESKAASKVSATDYPAPLTELSADSQGASFDALDLDLSGPVESSPSASSDNLIDFDLSGLIPPDNGSKPK